MKLLKRTYLYTAAWLFPLMLVGSLFSFYMIEYIAYEETDEFLTYEMERLLNYHEKNNDLPDFHKVAAIVPDVKYAEPFYKDTLMLESGDNEMVPYRELHFSIDHNGRDFAIVIRHLLPGRDDIAEGAFWIILGIMFLVTLSIIVTINGVAGKLWKPFYVTLNKINQFKNGNQIPEFAESKIDEFNQLNNTLHSFLKKISDDYRHNKEFNENASHELQTHLAIIKMNAEKLINKEENGSLDELQKIYSAATSLSQIQKSLLLLSKINNREFTHDTKVEWSEIIESALAYFDEVAGIRGLKIIKELSPASVMMDEGLAEILVNNLLKNAVKHNVENGYINVQLKPHSFSIQNSGHSFEGDPQELFQRFSKGPTGNNGIGLAIVKEICEIYHFQLTYTISAGNEHSIEIIFTES